MGNYQTYLVRESGGYGGNEIDMWGQELKKKKDCKKIEIRETKDQVVIGLRTDTWNRLVTGIYGMPVILSSKYFFCASNHLIFGTTLKYKYV